MADPCVNYLPLQNSLELLGYDILVNDLNTYESAHSWTFTDGSCAFDWNVVTFANTPLNNFFLLNSSSSGYQNLYYLGGVYAPSYLNLELPLLNTLNTIFLLILYFVLPQFKRTHALAEL